MTHEAELEQVSLNVERSDESEFPRYVRFLNKADSYIEWTVPLCQDSDYGLDFRYSLEAQFPHNLQLDINCDTAWEKFKFRPTGSWSVWSHAVKKFPLEEGENRIRLTTINERGPRLDSLRLELAQEASSGQFVMVTVDATFGVSDSVSVMKDLSLTQNLMS